MSLHGHAKIELTNVKTGEVQTVEHDNIVTNALSDIFSSPLVCNFIMSNNGIHEFLPIEQKALGGILLFKKEIDADPLKYDSLMETENITGYASNNVNSGTDTLRGSRNLTESKAIENGYRFVYDFTTSQANGEIACISLTSSQNGVNALSGIPNLRKSKNIYTNEISLSDLKYIGFATSFDEKTSILTCIKSITENKIHIVKFLLPLFETSNISITSKMTKTNDKAYLSQEFCPKIISEEDKILTENMLSITYNIWCENIDDNYIYNLSGDRQNKKLKLIRINKTNFELDDSYVIEKIDNSAFSSYLFDYGLNTTKQNIRYSDNFYIDTYQGSPFIHNNLIYLINGTNNIRMGFSLLDLSLIDSSSSIKSSRIPSDVMIINSKAFIIENTLYTLNKKNSNFYYQTTSLPLNMSSNNNFGLSFFLKKTREFINYGISSSSFNSSYILEINRTINLCYLATINNLDTPITKTPDQAMKITYTITEVEDE